MHKPDFQLSTIERAVAALPIEMLKQIILEENNFRASGYFNNAEISQKIGRDFCETLGISYDSTWVEAAMRAANRVVAIRSFWPDAI